MLDSSETEILQKVKKVGKVVAAVGLAVMGVSGVWWIWQMYQQYGLTVDFLGQVGSLILIIGLCVYFFADLRMKMDEDPDYGNLEEMFKEP